MVNNQDAHEAEKDECAVAKRKLLAILRSNPKVYVALRVTRQADDKTLLKALARLDGSSFDILRGVGFSIAEATNASDMLELALQAAPDAKTQERNTVAQGLKVLTGMAVLLLLILVGIVVWNLTQSTRGWELGDCSITMFVNSTCNQPDNQCNVELKVAGQRGWYAHSAWTLPITYTTAQGGLSTTSFLGSALKCCNNDQNMARDCCGMFDSDTRLFCDTWPGLSAPDGSSCPTGSWPCLYQLDEAREGYTRAVKPYDEPDVKPFFIPIVLISLCLLSGVVLKLRERCPCFKRCCQCWCSCCQNLSESHSDSEEDGDLEGQSPPHGKQSQRSARTLASPQVSPLAVGPASYRSSSGKQDAENDSGDSDDDGAPEDQETHGRPGRRDSEQSRTSLASSRRDSTTSSASLESRCSSSKRRSLSQDPRPHRDSKASTQSFLKSGFARSLSANPVGRTQLPDAPFDETLRKVSKTTGSTWSVPGTVDGHDISAKRFVAWSALDKPAHEMHEGDVHQSFRDGDLSHIEAKAMMEQIHLAHPIVEPLDSRQGRRLGGSRLGSKQDSRLGSRQVRRLSKHDGKRRGRLPGTPSATNFLATF